MFRTISLFIQRLISRNIYAICVLVVITLNMLFIAGLRRAFGIMVSALHQTFNKTSYFELNMVGDTYASFAYILMPLLASLVSYLNNCYQIAMFIAGILMFLSSLFTSMIGTPGMMFVTFTFLHGLASGQVLATVSLVVGCYFPKTHNYHVFATSLASAAPYGILVLTPILGHLVQTYGWRESFLIYGGLTLCISFLGTIFFLDQSDNYEEMDNKKEKKFKVSKWKFVSWSHLMEYKEGLCWLIDRIFNNIVMFAIGMNLTEFRRKVNNYSMEDSAIINICLGFGECFTFTTLLFIGDKFRGKLPLASFMGSLFNFFSIFVFTFSVHSILTVNVCTVIIGMAFGLNNAVLYAASAEALNCDGTISLPMSKMTGAIGTLVSPLFSGLMIDLYGYKGLFVSLIILNIIRISLLGYVNFAVYKRMKREAEIDNFEAENDAKYDKNEEKNVHEEYKIDEEIEVEPFPDLDKEAAKN